MARPSKYTDKLALHICKRIADGDSLRTICKDPQLPTKSTVLKWVLTHDEFADHYARARRIQAELLADEITDIADAEGDVQRDRLRVDTRKWYLSKVLPKVYGEKLDIGLPDGIPKIVFELTHAGDGEPDEG